MTGRTRAKVASSPPHMTASTPFSAPACPPETGASRNSNPRSPASAWSSRATTADAVVTPIRPGRPQLQAWLERLSEKAAGRDPALVVIDNLGQVARRLFTKAKPGGLVLTGGETAGRVFQELHADGAWIREEIDTGIGRAAVAGGPYDGMGLVIKPGSFGDGHTLVKAVERLSPRAVGTKAGDTGTGDTEIGDTLVGTTGPVRKPAPGKT